MANNEKFVVSEHSMVTSGHELSERREAYIVPTDQSMDGKVLAKITRVLDGKEIVSKIISIDGKKEIEFDTKLSEAEQATFLEDWEKFWYPKLPNNDHMAPSMKTLMSLQPFETHPSSTQELDIELHENTITTTSQNETDNLFSKHQHISQSLHNYKKTPAPEKLPRSLPDTLSKEIGNEKMEIKPNSISVSGTSAKNGNHTPSSTNDLNDMKEGNIGSTYDDESISTSLEEYARLIQDDSFSTEESNQGYRLNGKKQKYLDDQDSKSKTGKSISRND